MEDVWKKCRHPRNPSTTVGVSKTSPGGQCRLCRQLYQRGGGGRSGSAKRAVASMPCPHCGVALVLKVRP